MTKDETELIKLRVEPERALFFQNFELPLFRKPKPKDGRRWPHIEVGGDCLRIGKTTTKQVLVEQIGNRGLPFVFSDEDWKSNKYLEDAYKRKANSLLLSQKWYSHKKRDQLGTISDSSFWIQVTHPEMDFGYAMTNYLVGNLSPVQFTDYWSDYQALAWEKVPAPDLLVYLTASANILVSRFRGNARDFEKADEKYIRVMQGVNQKWLNLAKNKLPVWVIDTNNFDYSYQTGTQIARDELGKRFFERLMKEGWEF